MRRTPSPAGGTPPPHRRTPAKGQQTAAQLTEWRAASRAGAESDLKNPPEQGEEGVHRDEKYQLQATAGELALETELVPGGRHKLEAGPPAGPREIETMGATHSSSVNRPEGVAHVRRV